MAFLKQLVVNDPRLAAIVLNTLNPIASEMNTDVLTSREQRKCGFNTVYFHDLTFTAEPRSESERKEFDAARKEFEAAVNAFGSTSSIEYLDHLPVCRVEYVKRLDAARAFAEWNRGRTENDFSRALKTREFYRDHGFELLAANCQPTFSRVAKAAGLDAFAITCMNAFYRIWAGVPKSEDFTI